MSRLCTFYHSPYPTPSSLYMLHTLQIFRVLSAESQAHWHIYFLVCLEIQPPLAPVLKKHGSVCRLHAAYALCMKSGFSLAPNVDMAESGTYVRELGFINGKD